MTAPRRWRPSVLYVVSAVFAIVLILVWLFSGTTETPGPAIHPSQAPSSAPGK